MKIRPVGVVMFHADGRTDMTKLIVALRKFANALRNLVRNFYRLLWQEMDLIASLIPNVYVFCKYLLEVFCFLYDCTCKTKDASKWLNFHYMPISCHQEYGTEFEMCSWLSRDSYLFRPSCCMPLYDISNRTFHLPQKTTDDLAEFISKTVSYMEGSGSWHTNRC